MGYNETNPVTEAFEAHVQHFWLFDAGIYSLVSCGYSHKLELLEFVILEKFFCKYLAVLQTFYWTSLKSSRKDIGTRIYYFLSN
jgi:hypothetical protein